MKIDIAEESEYSMEVKEVVKIAIGYVARANASTVANIRGFGEGTLQRA